MQTDALEFQEIVFGTEDYQKAVSVRDSVLRKPLGLQYTAEQLQTEGDSRHLVCRLGSEIVGTVILKPESPKVVRMRQFAVKEEHQRKGVGRFLAIKSEDLAKQEGFEEILLHARESVLPFYEKLGYQAEGERFTEVTLPHLKMRKKEMPLEHG